MRKIFAAIFKFLAKSIAALFALLFIVTAIPVLLLSSFKHTLLQAGTYKRALAENGVYEQMPAMVAEQFSLVKDFLANPCGANPIGCAIDGASPELQSCLTDALGEDAFVQIGSGQRNPTEAEIQRSTPCLEASGDSSQAGPKSGLLEESQPSSDHSTVGPQMSHLTNLSPDQWQALILHLLPPDELQEMTESSLDQLFAYLNGERETVKIPLVKLKARLTGQAGQDLLLFLINTQPPCTKEQQARITSGEFGEEGQPQSICAASGATLDKLMTGLQEQLNEASVKIPDEATLVKPPSASDLSGGEGPLGNDPHTALQNINTAIRLSPLLPLGLLLLVALFGVRSIEGWLRWWGIPLFVAGVIALSIGIFILPVFEWAWIKYALPRFPPMVSTSSLIPLGHDLTRSIARDLATWMMLETGLIALLGLGAILGAWFRRRTKQSGDTSTHPGLVT